MRACVSVRVCACVCACMCVLHVAFMEQAFCVTKIERDFFRALYGVLTVMDKALLDRQSNTDPSFKCSFQTLHTRWDTALCWTCN